MKTYSLVVAAILSAFLLSPAHAQTGSVSGTSAIDAVNMAKTGVDPTVQNQIVSVYGVGTPASIKTWWVIFYDPSVPSHGRAVKIENDQIVREYEAKGGVVYADALTFAPSQVTSEGPALSVAQDYAAKHALAYDHIRVLFRVTAGNQDYRWRVQLMDGSVSHGFVFVSSPAGTFATYAPPGSIHTGSGSGGGLVGDVNRAANSVKDTFLGIGGDLQEFFTGERTVDQ